MYNIQFGLWFIEWKMTDFGLDVWKVWASGQVDEVTSAVVSVP